MDSNSRVSAFKMNGKEKNGPSDKVSFQLVLEVMQSVREI